MLADNTGNYDESFNMAGATILTAGIVCLPLLCLKPRLITETVTVDEDVVECTHL